MQNDSNRDGGSEKKRGCFNIQSITGARISGHEGDERVYETKSECLRTILQKMGAYPAASDQVYNSSTNYTAIFNSWLMSTGYMFTSTTIKDYSKTSIRGSYVEYGRCIRWTTREGLVEYQSQGTDETAKKANNYSCWQMFSRIQKTIPRVQAMCTTLQLNQEYALHEQLKWILDNGTFEKFFVNKIRFPFVQMEGVTNQGEMDQTSDRQVNTIITNDQTQTLALPFKELDLLSLNTSSEAVHNFPSLTNRWMPLTAITVSTNQSSGDLINTLYLPEALYERANSAPNLAPFEAFIYGRMSIELRIVANASKFHCGKLLISSKYDTYQCDHEQNDMQSALARNHVIIDLCANNEGLLDVPFRYHRPWVRLVKNSKASIGIRPSKYCSIYSHILSPLQTGTGGTTDVSVRIFYRFKEIAFTGMSYRVTVQGFGIEDVISPPTCRALKEVLVGAEKAFDQLGKSGNQDKPSKVEGIIVTPRPRLNFGGGKGIIDVQPLRVNPHTLTNFKDVHIPSDEPRSFLDMARIWGVWRTSSWSKNDKEGVNIIRLNIDPTSREYTKDYSGTLTPLEYACSNFMFWSGTIELRFDFVSNSFHTGAVQISAEFGRVTDSESESESSATYTKMFHLGEQKSVHFRVPYIYDTIYRRTTDSVGGHYLNYTTSTAIKRDALSVAPESRTFVKVRVINTLNPVSTAPQSIQILTFIRAGEDFVMHGIKNFGLIPIVKEEQMDNFPLDGYAVNTEQVIDPPVIPPSQTPHQYTPEEIRILRRIEELNRGKAKLLAKTDRNDWNEYKSTVIPKTQMDTGEKEDLDRTSDFRAGLSNQTIQTLDCHTSFKDLLRRPYLLLNQVNIAPINGGGYFIPLMPPSKNMSIWLRNDEYQANAIWAQTIHTTSASAIMDCFRAWRGGMRYTIVVNKGTKPIYVSLVPHSGTRIMGMHSPLNTAETGPCPLYGMNFSTEIIIPSINPSAVIEAPYDTENTWSLTFEENPSRNYTWRDKADTNSGHLCIQAMEAINVSVFWSAADDFEIANFYGPSSGKQNGWAYRYNDITYPKVQMDFQTSEMATKVGHLVSNVISNKGVMSSIGKCAPYVGAGLLAHHIGKKMTAITNVVDTNMNRLADTAETVGGTICTVKTSLESTFTSGESLENKLERLTRTVEGAGEDFESISYILNLAIEKVSSAVGSVLSGSVLVYDFLLDVLMAWMEGSWSIVAIGILRFLSKTLLSTNSLWSLMSVYIPAFAAYLKSLSTKGVPVVQAPPSQESTITGILLGIVGTVFGVVLDPKKTRSFPSALFERLTNSQGIQYLLGVLRFVQGIFDAIKTLVMEALGYVSPEARALKILAQSNELINSFIREAQIITSEANGMLINVPKFRQRFWKTVLTAHQLQRIICGVPANCVSPQLMRLCGEVIKVGNEKFMDLSSSPVRFEPMVICIEGPPGVGKSFATEEIAKVLLQEVGFTQPSSESIYYRTPGEKFWSGYRDQPVIVYDEWLNVNDPLKCTEVLAELMKLKSTAIFIPEMAHLEEKKIRGNPYLIILLCNGAFPSVSDYMRYPKAIYRRRDLVFRCERSQEYKDKDLRSLSAAELEASPHLQFKVYTDPTNERSLNPEARTFAQTLIFMKNRFKRYWLKEKEIVQVRMSRLPQFAGTTTTSLRLEDPFTLFYELNCRIQEDETLSQNGWTPYEQLEAAVEMISQAVNHHQEAVEEVEIPEELTWAELITSPVQQGPLQTGLTILGFLVEGGFAKYLMAATAKVLLKWKEQLFKMQPITGSCGICREEKACLYVCKSTVHLTEGQHFMCSDCFIAREYAGELGCFECDCPDMCTVVRSQDISTVSLLVRIARVMHYSLTWVVERLMEWYGWRRKNRVTFNGLASAYFMGVLGVILSALVGDTELTFNKAVATSCIYSTVVEVCFSIGSMFRSKNKYQGRSNYKGIPTSQIDSWEETRDCSETAITQEYNDLFKPGLNEIIFEKMMVPQEQREGCLHHKLFELDSNSILEGEKWLLVDTETSRYIAVSSSPCTYTKCPLLNYEKYKEFCLEYLKGEEILLRGNYIDYYNNPSLLLKDRIPPLFRPVWMTDFEEKPLTQDWWQYLSTKWDQYRKFILYSISIGAVLGAMLGIYKMTGFFMQKPGSQACATEYEPNSPRHRRAHFETRTGERRFIQSESDNPTVFEVVQKYILKNTIVISMARNGKEKIMYGTGLFNHYALIPRHYVVELKRGIHAGALINCWPLNRPQEKIHLNLIDSDFSESKTSDIAYLKLPASMQLFKDIRKYLAKEADLEVPLPSEGILMASPYKGSDFMREVLTEVKGISDRQVVIDQDGQFFEVRDVLVYGYSQPGACGSFLLRENHQRPILSMHFAG